MSTSYTQLADLDARISATEQKYSVISSRCGEATRRAETLMQRDEGYLFGAGGHPESRAEFAKAKQLADEAERCEAELDALRNARAALVAATQEEPRQ